MSDGDDMPPSFESSQWGRCDIGGICEIITDMWMSEVFWLNSGSTQNFLFTKSK